MFGKSFYNSVCCFLVFAQSFGQHSEQGIKEKEIVSRKRILSNKIDENVKESSGLVYFDHGLWTMNDSGNPPFLFKIDTNSGKILRRVFVENFINNDWEALTQDDSFLYIGDFGNNFGNRKDLQILKIAKKEMEKDTVKAESIQFSYACQTNFQLPLNGHNFDCEAFCAVGDSLFLFSKNWANHKTYLYTLPKFPGKYSITAIDSFNADGLITDADYDKDNKTLVLLGYNIKKISVHSFLWVFRDFGGTKFFSGKENRIELHLFIKQTEGIAHSGNLKYYFTNEMIRKSIIRIRPKLWGLRLIFRE